MELTRTVFIFLLSLSSSYCWENSKQYRSIRSTSSLQGCSSSRDRKILIVGCEPRKKFVTLSTNSSELKLIRDQAYVNRCNGTCPGGKKCMPYLSKVRQIKADALDLETKVIKCVEIYVEEDVICRCMCPPNPCTKHQEYDKNISCSCSCPQKHYCSEDKHWNHGMCKCECKQRSICSTGTKWNEDICRCEKSQEDDY